MIRFTGVNHLAFATGDMDKTVRFWRDLLGMRLIATLGRPGFRHYFFELSPTDTVAFFEWEGVEGVEEKPHGVPVRGPFIFDHVSFGVDSADNLWALKEKLAAADLDVSDVIDHGFILSHPAAPFIAPLRPEKPARPAYHGVTPEPGTAHAAESSAK